MSEASSLTGGRLNSWAVSAGNQAKQEYDQRLNDVIPKLEAQAYDRYLAEIENDRRNLQALSGLDNEAFRRMIQERNFQYGAERDRVGDERYNAEQSYRRERDAANDQRYLEERDYKRGRDTIDDHRYLDELEYQRRMRERDFNYRSRQDRDQNARAWANIQMSREDRDYRRERDAANDQRYLEERDYKRAMDKAEAERKLQAEDQRTQEQIYKAIENDMRKSGDARKWYLREFRYMTQDERNFAFSLLSPEEQNAVLRAQIEESTHRITRE